MNGMDPSLLVTYISVTFLLVITPGATTAIVVRNTLHRGVRAGAATAFGAATGNSSHAAAVGLGLAVLFDRFPGVLRALGIGGALYLAWLAIGSFSRAWQADRSLADGAASGSAAGRSAFRDGLLVNLTNPPILTFYLMVPAFLPKGAPPWMFGTLAAIHVTMALACHLGWALAFDRLRRLVARPHALRALDVGAGAALLLLAARSLAAWMK